MKSLGPQTLLFPTPVLIVGTYDKLNRPNAAAVAWGGICCSKPPCINISLRQATYTFGNILERKAFTVNIPGENYIKEADFFGIASGRQEDKFSSTGLTPIKSELVDAPFIKEFPFVLECALVESVNLGLHTIFIGEIKDVKAGENMVTGNIPDIKKIKPLIFNPADRAYYSVGKYVADAFSIGKK